MSDLQKYIEKRKKSDSEFAKSYDSGYEEFKIGVILREARRKSGLTQEELARRIQTTKSAISRIENHAEDIKLSTIEKVAKALGKKIVVEVEAKRDSPPGGAISPAAEKTNRKETMAVHLFESPR